MEVESNDNGMFGRKKRPAYYALGMLACLAMIVICLIPQESSVMNDFLFVKIFLIVTAVAGLGVNYYHLKN